MARYGWTPGGSHVSLPSPPRPGAGAIHCYSSCTQMAQNMKIAEFLQSLPFPTETLRHDICGKLKEELIAVNMLDELSKEEFEEMGITGVGFDVLFDGISSGALERFLQVNGTDLEN
jgi:hypothetical protein